MEQLADFEKRIEQFLNEKFSDAIVKTEDFRGDRSYFVKKSALFEIAQALFEEDALDVKALFDITSVDWYGEEESAGGRFEVVYNFYSISNQYRFFIKVMLPEANPKIASLTPIFASADWLEREVYDLMGIEFEGHPELTKILTPDDLEGFPLRRDYPLTYEVPRFTYNKNEPPEVIK